jgi:hypothetical protein
MAKQGRSPTRSGASTTRRTGADWKKVADEEDAFAILIQAITASRDWNRLQQRLAIASDPATKPAARPQTVRLQSRVRASRSGERGRLASR